MKLETAEKIVAAGEEAGFRMSVYENYSGRGMFGKQTTGVSYRHASELNQAICAANIAQETKGLRSDNLGMGYISY